MSSSRQKLGQWGEELAAEYLTSLGYQIIARNYRTPYGEVDLIARHIGEGHSATVFIEVKTRTGTAFGLPEASVTRRKQEHLLNSAQYFLQEHPEMEEHWRFDVIAIERPVKWGEPVITLFENAFREQP